MQLNQYKLKSEIGKVRFIAPYSLIPQGWIEYRLKLTGRSLGYFAVKFLSPSEFLKVFKEFRLN